MQTLFLCFLLVLTACQKPAKTVSSVPSPVPKSEEGAQPSSLPSEPDTPEVPFILKAELVPLAEPNRYAVKLTWHEGTALAENWRLTREDGDSAVGIARVREEVREVTDEKTAAGTTYRYQLWLERGGETFLHASATAKIPRDLVVKGESTRSEIRGFHRLFLEKDARLRSESGKLSIEVGEIYSEDATIETFAEGRAAKSGSAGRSGGLLSVKAARASGRLRLVARGENGGAGAEGNIGHTGEEGNGGHAALAHPNCEVGRNCPNLPHPGSIRINTQQELDALLAQVSAHYGSCGPSPWRVYFRCLRSAAPGFPGGNGQAGGRGQDGFVGGDSSPFIVDITDARGLKLVVSREPGIGGAGGRGGRGGDGGRGGRTGDRDPHCVCDHTEVPRQNGAPGSAGPDGIPGPRGKEAPYCLRLNGVEQGECDKVSSSAE